MNYYDTFALFARTPHPYNTNAMYVDPRTGESTASKELPRRINRNKIRRNSGLTEDAFMDTLAAPSRLDESGRVMNSAQRQLWADYSPQQIQAVQRKAMLRPDALRLDEASAIYPDLSKRQALNLSYNAMRNPDARRHITDANTLTRYERQLAGNAPAGMPLVSPEKAIAARERLASLNEADWDFLTSLPASVDDIRSGASPAKAFITDKTSPIRRGAKTPAVEGLRSRARANPGTTPRLPAYVENPESILYAVDDSPAAQAGKRLSMGVRYSPSAPRGGQSAAARRVDSIRRARELTNQEMFPTTALPAARPRQLPGSAPSGLAIRPRTDIDFPPVATSDIIEANVAPTSLRTQTRIQRPSSSREVSRLAGRGVVVAPTARAVPKSPVIQQAVNAVSDAADNPNLMQRGLKSLGGAGGVAAGLLGVGVGGTAIWAALRNQQRQKQAQQQALQGNLNV